MKAFKDPLPQIKLKIAYFKIILFNSNKDLNLQFQNINFYAYFLEDNPQKIPVKIDTGSDDKFQDIE